MKKRIEESIHTSKKDRTFVSVWIDSIDKDKSCYGKYYFCFNYTANELVQYFEDLEKRREEKIKAEEEKRKKRTRRKIRKRTYRGR